MKLKLFLIILLWLGLPLSLYGTFVLFEIPMANNTASRLFLMYIGFSWSIAFLIFILESARRQLLQPDNPFRSALRLGLYTTIAVFLAWFASPESAFSGFQVILRTSIVSFSYGTLMGYLYHISARPKQLDQ